MNVLDRARARGQQLWDDARLRAPYRRGDRVAAAVASAGAGMGLLGVEPETAIPVLVVVYAATWLPSMRIFQDR